MSAKAREFWRGNRGQSGASAIEFALILPLIILLYAGMIDLTLYISASRKVTNAANILSDVITQQTMTITAASIDDSFTGAKLAMRPIAADEVGLNVRNYRKTNGKISNQWSRTSASGPDCDLADSPSLDSLMSGNNDIVIAVACTKYAPLLSKALPIFSDTEIIIVSEIKLRPRESNTIDCSDC